MTHFELTRRAASTADLTTPLAIALLLLAITLPAMFAPWDGSPAPEHWRGNSASLER